MKSVNSEKECRIIVAARNEERTIFRTLSSIQQSVSSLAEKRRCELIVVINGCTDDTEAEVNRFLNSQVPDSPFYSTQLMHSSPGLIEAQRCAVEASQLRGPILFFDADVILSANCVGEFLRALENPAVQVAYAKNIAVCSKPSIFSMAVNFHHLVRDVRTPRRYFHGRAFAVRSYPEHATPDHRALRVLGRYRFLQLEKGPQVDDVYLSRVFAHAYGPDCMRECRQTAVYFTPITSLRDFYCGVRRLFFEIRRLNLLFPEHCYLQDTIFVRRIDPHQLSALPLRQKAALWTGNLIERGCRAAVRLEFSARVMLEKCALGGNATLWPILTSTKRSLHVEP